MSNVAAYFIDINHAFAGLEVTSAHQWVVEESFVSDLQGPLCDAVVSPIVDESFCIEHSDPLFLGLQRLFMQLTQSIQVLVIDINK